MKERVPPIRAVIICIYPIDVRNMLGNPINSISIKVEVYKNPTLKSIPNTPPITFLNLETLKESNTFEIMIKGIK